MKTDLRTRRDSCYFCNNSFSTGGNVFLLVEESILSVGRTVIFPMAETQLRIGGKWKHIYFLHVKATLPVVETHIFACKNCFLK